MRRFCAIFAIVSIIPIIIAADLRRPLVQPKCNKLPTIPLEFCGPTAYHLSELKGSYFTALAFCRLNDMNLVSVESAEEHECLAKLINKTAMNQEAFWMSATDLDMAGKYVWMGTGRRLGAQTYSNWVAGEPSGSPEHCIGMWHEHNHQWNDFVCDRMHSFICEMQTSFS